MDHLLKNLGFISNSSDPCLSLHGGKWCAYDHFSLCRWLATGCKKHGSHQLNEARVGEDIWNEIFWARLRWVLVYKFNASKPSGSCGSSSPNMHPQYWYSLAWAVVIKRTPRRKNAIFLNPKIVALQYWAVFPQCDLDVAMRPLEAWCISRLENKLKLHLPFVKCHNFVRVKNHCSRALWNGYFHTIKWHSN